MRIIAVISILLANCSFGQIDSTYLEIVPEIMLGFPERTGHIIHSDTNKRTNPFNEKDTADKSVQFGRIYRGMELRKDDQDLFGFSLVPGDKYVFLLYRNDEPENSLSYVSKIAFQLDELPTEKTIISKLELDQISYIHRDNYSSGFIDIPEKEKKTSLKIFPFKKNEFRILFFDEEDSYNKPIPLYDTNVVSFYMNYYNDTLVYRSTLPRNKRPLMESRDYLEDRGLLADPKGEVTIKIMYPNDVNTYYHYEDGTLTMFKNFSEDFIVYFKPKEPGMVYESAFVHYEVSGSNGELAVTSVGEDDDEPRAKGKYVNYTPKGKWIYKYPSQQVLAKGKYKQGEGDGAFGHHGKWRYYYSNGQLMAQGKYKYLSKENRTLMLDNWQFFNDQGKRVESLPGVRTIKGNSIFLPLPNYLAVMRTLLKIYDQTW